MMTVVEIAVEDVAGVVAATRGGANRVEFARELWCGGLTPELDDIPAAIAAAPAGGIQILVRPRPGSFTYTPEEIRDTYHTLRRLRAQTRQAPVPVGFVVGALLDDGTIDEVAAAAFRAAAGHAPLTFHRAFDSVPDRDVALETLIGLGYERVLTTGGDQTRAQPEELAHLIRVADKRTIILTSGGLREGNVAAVMEAANPREVHMRAPSSSGAGTDVNVVKAIVAQVEEQDRISERSSTSR